jgi:formate dehydrogenase gamma subunit
MKRSASILTLLFFLLFVIYQTKAGVQTGEHKTAAAETTNAATANATTQASTKDPTTGIRLDCAACHGPNKTLPYMGGAFFHKEAHEAYSHGFHAQALKNGSKAASCLDCHAMGGDMTTILPAGDSKSTINRANIARTCGSCHSKKSVMEGTGISNRPFLAYQESAHARAIARGQFGAAVCTDCHNSHDILPASNELSPIFKANIPKTCAKCHSQVANEFVQSVHGQAVERGVSQAPVCTDCHGIHTIKPHTDARAMLGTTACAQCHQGVRLTQEFGIQGDRVSSYEDSYHGMARKLGSQVAADCASCHGVHNILASSNPKSMIHRDNLVKTCGQCHIGAGEKFAMGNVHLDVPAAQDAGSVATRWVRWIYLILISLTIGGMALHNLLVWRKKAAARRRAERRTIVRMNAIQRWQHWLLLSSFFVLVVTGFALKYPDSWVGSLLGSSEALRRITHRLAGVVMIAVGLFHIGYMLLTREGRVGLRDFWPRKKDLLDFIQNLRYYLGLAPTRPKFARFGYGEKAEYWAVVWGTFVMGLTGLMVWFKVEAFSFLPRWFIDIALAIHWYEAILATLAILVWHIYNVIFDPDVYPLNWAVVDGLVSEEYYKEEHELDYEKMKAAEAGSDDSRGQSTSEDDASVNKDDQDLLPAETPGD